MRSLGSSDLKLHIIKYFFWCGPKERPHIFQEIKVAGKIRVLFYTAFIHEDHVFPGEEKIMFKIKYLIRFFS